MSKFKARFSICLSGTLSTWAANTAAIMLTVFICASLSLLAYGYYQRITLENEAGHSEQITQNPAE